MEVLDPGHKYQLASLDNVKYNGENILFFVKREGPGYPGNVGHHHGTTIQEVCRALIDRLQYVNGQIYCIHNDFAMEHLRSVIEMLELRAAERHGRSLVYSPLQMEHQLTCSKCGHIQCPGTCRKES